MPYKIQGSKILSKSGGKWHTKQVCKSAENAKKAVKLLYAIENDPNFKPKKKRSK